MCMLGEEERVPLYERVGRPEQDGKLARTVVVHEVAVELEPTE